MKRFIITIILIAAYAPWSNACDPQPFDGYHKLWCTHYGFHAIDVSNIDCIDLANAEWDVDQNNNPFCSQADGPDPDNLAGDAMCTNIGHYLRLRLVVTDELGSVNVGVTMMSPHLLNFSQPPTENHRVETVDWYLNGVYQGTFTLGDNWATAYYFVATISGPAGEYEITFEANQVDLTTYPNAIMTAIEFADFWIEGECGAQDTTPPTINCPTDTLVTCIDDVPLADPDLVVASDSCGPVTVEHLGDVSDGNCPATLTRTYRATDQSGNTAICEQLITVWDTIPPSIVCPPDVTLDCVSDPSAYSPDSLGYATATDNCATTNSMIIQDFDTWTDLGNGSYVLERMWVVQDGPTGCCLYDTCYQTINILFGEFEQVVDPTCNSFEQEALSTPCMTSTLYYSNEPGDCFQIPTADALGINNYAPARIEVDGTTDLVDGQVRITFFSPDSTYLADNNRLDSIGYTLNNVPQPKVVVPESGGNELAINVQPGDIIQFTVDPADIINSGGLISITYFRQFTQSGDCGGCDTTTVTIDCPGDVELSCEDSLDPIQTGTPTTTPVADTIYYVDQVVPSNCDPYLSVVVRMWYAELDGAIDSCQQLIGITDTIAPTIVCPPDSVISCGDQVPPADTASVIADDNCNYTVYHDGDEQIGDSLVLRTYIVVDDCGNADTCVQTFTLELSQILEIVCPDTLYGTTVPPLDLSLIDTVGTGTLEVVNTTTVVVGCDSIVTHTIRFFGNCGEEVFCDVVMVGTANALILECPEVTLLAPGESTPVPDPGSVISNGAVVFLDSIITYNGCQKVTEYLYEASNSCGVDTCVHTFVQYEQTLALLEWPSDTLIDVCDQLPVNWSFVWDNCSSAIQLDVWSQSDSLCEESIMYSAVLFDQFGNTSDTVNWFVDKFDDTAPVFTNTPDPLYLVSCGEGFVPDLPTWTDCSTTTLVDTFTVTSDSCALTTTYTRTVIDCAGNSSTHVSIVVEVDDEAPVLPNLPATITVNSIASADSLIALWGTMLATDDCNGDVPVQVATTYNPDSTLVLVTLTATDDCGNQGFVQVMITIDGNNGNPFAQCHWLVVRVGPGQYRVEFGPGPDDDFGNEAQLDVYTIHGQRLYTGPIDPSVYSETLVNVGARNSVIIFRLTVPGFGHLLCKHAGL